MAARFKLKRRGVRQLLKSPEVQAEMVRRAELVKAAAEAQAPVGTPPGDPHPGLYKTSVKITSKRSGGRNKDRAVAYATNTAPYARWVEYGNGSGPARHVMLRAGMAGGG